MGKSHAEKILVTMIEPVIIVHGGYVWPTELKESALSGVKDAARKGHAVLSDAGSAVDAVEAAVKALEDNPSFNCGHGSVLNSKGEIEMDAIVIDGKTMNSGAVCGLRGCSNPVHVARLVMEKTSHCLLCGEGAQEFMASQGIPTVPDSQLIVPRREKALEKAMGSLTVAPHESSASSKAAPETSPGCDTVGAVAMDANGNLAVATSTGGTPGKLPGRVGDSPIIGSGGYADSAAAISCTGVGESIMRVCLSRRVAELLERGRSAQEAAVQSVEFMAERVGGMAGVIVLSKVGDRCQLAHHSNTPRMAWAAVSDGHVTCGIEQGQEEKTPL